MRQVSAALRAAIDAGERVIRSEFTMDWDNDGIQDIDVLSHKVGQLALTQSLESSLPAQVQLVPGVAIAELTARIERGNDVRYAVNTNFRSVSTATSINASQYTVPKPTTAVPGDVVLVAIFISWNPSLGASVSLWDMRDANVQWTVLSVRGDGSSARIEGVLLQRRVTASDPANYTINLPQNASVLYATAAVDVGNADLMGITDYASKGEDNISTVESTIAIPPVDVDVPGSLIVSFYAASGNAVTGTAFSPDITSGDVEQVEFSTASPLVSGAANIRVAVMTTSNVAQGRYLKFANVTGATPTSQSLAFAVVLAPKLAGNEAQHAAWTFSELNPNSPYAGKIRLRRPTKWDIYFATENGFERVPLFTGFSTAPSASSGNRVVTLKALDNRETMRTSNKGQDLVAEYPTNDLIFGKKMLPGLEATWMVSYLAFHAFNRRQLTSVFSFDNQLPWLSGRGYFASPLVSKYASIWVPMHGSLHPLIGALAWCYVENTATSVKRRAEFAIGPFVAATRNQPIGTNTYGVWNIQSNYTPWNFTTNQLVGRIQCWVKRNQTTSSMQIAVSEGAIPATTYMWLEMQSTGTLRLRVEIAAASRTITGPVVPADDAWHFVGAHFDSTTGSVTFRLDTMNTVVAMTTWANSVPVGNSSYVGMSLVAGTQIAELQVIGGYASSVRKGVQLTDAWANENFVPSAFIDKSENILDCIPFIDPQTDSFSILSDIAAAEFAAVYFDADGYLHFRTARSDVSPTGQTVQKMITARRSIRDISYESGVMQIANIISVEYTVFGFVLSADVFSAGSVISVAAYSTLTFSIVAAGPITALGTPTWSANSTPDGLGYDLSYNVTVNVQQPGATANIIQVDIQNRSASAIFLVDPSGNPNLHIVASWMAPSSGNVAPVKYTDIDSVRKYGDQPMPTLGGSVWIQREESAASVALKLLSDLADAKPVITDLTIKGDPTLEFGDLTTIVDVNGLGVNGSYRITGKNPTYDTNGFSQSLVVRSAPAIAYWDLNSWDDGTVWG